MIKVNTKTKGFTLMELLVVIVILALLILLAGPAVLRLMEGGQQDIFVQDVQRIIEISETAFTDKSMRNDNSIKTTSGAKYMCVSLDNLIDDGYLSKEIFERDTAGKITARLWNGWVEITVPTTGTGGASYKVTITNGTYTLEGVDSSRISSTDLTAVTLTNVENLTKPENCPAITKYNGATTS